MWNKYKLRLFVYKLAHEVRGFYSIYSGRKDALKMCKILYIQHFYIRKGHNLYNHALFFFFFLNYIFHVHLHIFLLMAYFHPLLNM